MSKNNYITSVKVEKSGPVAKDFKPEELKLIDIDGLQRTYLKITFKELNDDTYFFMRDVAFNQYKLPMKYLKPVPNSYSYISQKSQISGKEKDIKNAGIVIEPLNADYFNLISYTPINQAIPLGTIVTIDVETPFNTVDGHEPERMFIWSNNLQTDSDIKDKIKAEKKNSERLEPWIRCCHFGAIDIGSRLTAKYEVATVDTDILHSFSLFGFSRSDERKEFTIWTFNYFNTSPFDVLRMMKGLKGLNESTPSIIDNICNYDKQ